MSAPRKSFKGSQLVFFIFKISHFKFKFYILITSSGPNDNVFVFFADHGAPGIVAFPDGSAVNQIKSIFSIIYYKFFY